MLWMQFITKNQYADWLWIDYAKYQLATSNFLYWRQIFGIHGEVVAKLIKTMFMEDHVNQKNQLSHQFQELGHKPIR